MSKHIKALKLALEALERFEGNKKLWPEAITAIKEALAQTQEPVAFDCCGNCLRPKHEHQGDNCPKPYTTTWNAWDYPFAPDTTPPQRTWVGLTDDEELQLAGMMDKSRHWLVAEVEAKLKEKNT